MTVTNVLCLPGNRALLPSLTAPPMAESSEAGGLIVFNGAMVDVGSMMTKLDKSEKAREEIEQKLIVLDAKMGEKLNAVCVDGFMFLYLELASYTLCQKSLGTVSGSI